MNKIQISLCALALVVLPITGFRFQARPQWIEKKSAHYTVLYRAGYEKDAEFTAKWMRRTEQLMKTKYGITADRYHISVYLLPAPGEGIDVQKSGENVCCTKTASGIKTGTIKLLTLSSATWTENLKSSLGLPKNGVDYHAKVLVSEYVPIGHYAVQDGRTSGGWNYYDAPNWFVQGLQEYDAIFHTTDYNRTVTSKRLVEWAKRNPDKFTCCTPRLGIADDYNGGAAFMTFLADKFGEDIHARILRSSSPTFESALASETKPYSLAELFKLFQKWVEP
jgi:hypothetical protein